MSSPRTAYHPWIELCRPDTSNFTSCNGDSHSKSFETSSGLTGYDLKPGCGCSRIRTQLLAHGITGGTVYLNVDGSIRLVNGVPFPKAK